MSADMPDAGASRKRQIQITPGLFRGAGVSRAFPTNGRYPVSRVWADLFGLCGLSERASGAATGTTCVMRDPASGEFRRGLARRARPKSREIDSMSRVDSILRASRFRALRARAPKGLPHSINAINAFRSREISDFHHLSPVFAPGWASAGGETPAAAGVCMR